VWVALWFAVFAFDQVYIKHVCDTVPMTSWGRVYYTNLLSVIPVTLLGLGFGEHKVIMDFVWTAPSVWSLLASCLCGVGMSYSAFWLRSLVRSPRAPGSLSHSCPYRRLWMCGAWHGSACSMGYSTAHN
jgi:solute carrier family 35 protein